MSAYLAQNNVRRLHLELTEKCNAACPLCIRTNPDGLTPQPYIGNNELHLEDLSRFLNESIKKNLTDVHLCGTYGDPTMARDCLEIVDFLCSTSCAVSMSTNGSARSTKWWSKLGQVAARNPRSRVDFHIDGLADTNSFYRRNTKFARIMNNASAFIAEGGQANWEFIPFKHNEHQVEEARALSKRMKFARFTIKKSNWMFSEKRPRISFKDNKGRTHHIEAPSTLYRPETAKNRVSQVTGTHQGEITCLAQFRQEVYISCEGIVYPCCWTARRERERHIGRQPKDGFSEVFTQLSGRDHFSIYKNSFESMLDNELFSILAEKWKKQLPAICYKKCGLKNQPEKIKTWNK